MSEKLSIYLCYLLRHCPQDAGLTMDSHGWVSVNQLIKNVNAGGKYALDLPTLRKIVAEDEKGRYRFSDDGRRIRCCQGHSVPGVTPELRYGTPPPFLYHGTHSQAAQAIRRSGGISKGNRHAVHLHADRATAWSSATRWHKKPVLLKIDAARMAADGFRLGEADNHVWCVDNVPVKYIVAEEWAL